MINSKILEECDLKESEVIFFKNHKINVKEIENIKIIDFKTPGTNEYYIRYIFDNDKIIVTGDLGSAIYEWNGCITLKKISIMGPHNFNQKCSCSSEGKQEWCGDIAEKGLTEHWESNFKEEYERLLLEADNEIDYDYTRLDELEEIKDCLDDLIENSEDYIEYSSIARKYYIDYESDGWIHELGNRIPIRHKLHLFGLKVIGRELEEHCSND